MGMIRDLSDTQVVIHIYSTKETDPVKAKFEKAWHVTGTDDYVLTNYRQGRGRAPYLWTLDIEDFESDLLEVNMLASNGRLQEKALRVLRSAALSHYMIE